MNEVEFDRKVYDLAMEFLLGLNIPGLNEQTINKYLHPSYSKFHEATISEIYKRCLESAQNSNMKSGVIGKAIGGIDKLSAILDNFNPKYVVEKYSDWRSIFDEIKEKLKPAGKMRETSMSIWPQYCRTIISSAKFINQFNTADEFYNWVEFFDKDNRARVALPMLLAQEIDGFGFSLACDFLKELGFENFCKPDVHITKIFKELNLCPLKANDFQVFKAVIRLANNANVTPYNADKLFYLIGSGDFYNDQQIGNKGKIKSHRNEFIEYVKNKVSLN